MSSSAGTPARATNSGGAKTFLAIRDADNKTILGFYSLSPASVDYARTPDITRRGLAGHDVQGFRLARLAVDRRLQGRGIGGQLLLAAGRRRLLASAEAGAVVPVIDAKNERVARWYATYGAYRCWTRRYHGCFRSRQSKPRLKKPGNTGYYMPC
jgi:GNAT superfamily N-acetyltransferase